MNPQSSLTVGAATEAPPAAAIVLLTPKEAAEFLKVSVSWLAKARMRGDGPPYSPVGRSIRYRQDHLLEWMEARRRLSSRD